MLLLVYVKIVDINGEYSLSADGHKQGMIHTDIKPFFKSIICNQTGKWYLQSWFIALLFALFPLVIPPFLGIILICLQNHYINQLVLELENADFEMLRIKKREKELDDREASMIEQVEENTRRLLRREYEEAVEACRQQKKIAALKIESLNKEADSFKKNLAEYDSLKKDRIVEIESLDAKIESLSETFNQLQTNCQAFRAKEQEFVDLQLQAIDLMIDGHEFEFYFASLLLCIGYNKAEVTRGSGDFGVDILAERDHIKYAIQCKRYSQPVGVAAVQEVFSGASHCHCHVGIVATNLFFTPQAQEHARAINIVLWDRNYIIQLLKAKYELEHGLKDFK